MPALCSPSRPSLARGVNQPPLCRATHPSLRASRRAVCGATSTSSLVLAASSASPQRVAGLALSCSLCWSRCTSSSPSRSPSPRLTCAATSPRRHAAAPPRRRAAAPPRRLAALPPRHRLLIATRTCTGAFRAGRVGYCAEEGRVQARPQAPGQARHVALLRRDLGAAACPKRG